MKTVKKITDTEYEIAKMIKSRWSPRVFSDQKITEEEMHQILEAGRWAPSSSNLQPWRIIWGIKGTETYNRIFDCLDPFNKKWAGNGTALMACAFKKDMDNGKDNFHALYDLGLFAANVTYQAESMGIAVHQMAGIDYKKAAKEFKFPENYHVATGISLGYYGGDPDDLNEDLRKSELKAGRERKPQSSFAFNGNFENKK